MFGYCGVVERVTQIIGFGSQTEIRRQLQVDFEALLYGPFPVIATNNCLGLQSADPNDPVHAASPSTGGTSSVIGQRARTDGDSESRSPRARRRAPA